MVGMSSITITNHTNKPIDITTVQNSISDADRKKTHHIDPKDTMTIFTDHVESLIWENSK